jgi:outer membrane autotransporter protein
MLSGSGYANYLQSFSSLGVHYNDLLDHATNCEVPALAGSVLECRASGPIHVWGQLDYQMRKADGDIEAGTMKSKRFTGLLGIDANVGNSAILGVSAGMVTNHTRDHQFGDSFNADGMQVGAYAVYDPGAFFVKGVTTYSWYDGDSSRNVNFAGLAPGATYAAHPTGDPDVKMWTAGLHGGARLPMGGNSVVTPYLNLDYVHAKMGEFIETGSSGAELHLGNNKSSRTFLTGGVKWATQMGGVVPEVNLGYRYRFGGSRTSITEAFMCQIDTCAFDVISAAQKRGTFLAGVSVGGKLGPVDVRIGYEGEFNSDITSHSGNFKFVLPLGGHAAPPPPPPPAPVIAPPPPVEVAPPPPPPPPPPAPVERGERGQ